MAARIAVVSALALLAVACSDEPPHLDLAVELVDSTWDWNGIFLDWPDPPFAVDAWVVERTGGSDGGWAVLWSGVEQKPGQGDSYPRFTDSGLVPGQPYGYRIAACTEHGKTNYTEVAEGVAPDFMPGLPPPIATLTPMIPAC